MTSEQLDAIARDLESFNRRIIETNNDAGQLRQGSPLRHARLKALREVCNPANMTTIEFLARLYRVRPDPHP